MSNDSKRFYGEIWDAKKNDWVSLDMEAARDDDGRHLVHLTAFADDDFGLRLTADQAARLVVRLTDLMGGTK